MNHLQEITDLLIAERDRVTRAIEALAGDTRVSKMRQGRPKISRATSTENTGVAHHAQTPKYRREQSKRMKEYWANMRAKRVVKATSKTPPKLKARHAGA
jgi:hypothetical protein